jgi:cyclic lactone autoinducer peptide
MSTMKRKIAGAIAEVSKKTAIQSSKQSMFFFFKEPKMPECLIRKQK